MRETAHTEFSDILLKGTRQEKGMGNFSGLLSVEDEEAIHAYLIDLAWKTYEHKKGASRPHQPEAISGTKGRNE